LHNEGLYDFHSSPTLVEQIKEAEMWQTWKRNACRVGKLEERPRSRWEDNNKLSLWSRVLIEKLVVSQLVKKFSAFYETQQFITTFITAHHLYLS
jgi:hypothetical protein